MAKRIRKSARKFTQVVNFTLVQMSCDPLVLICVGWPNREKLASTCVRIWGRPSQRKSTQVNASRWPNETQVGHKSKTWQWLASTCESVWQGLYNKNLNDEWFTRVTKYIVCCVHSWYFTLLILYSPIFYSPFENKTSSLHTRKTDSIFLQLYYIWTIIV